MTNLTSLINMRAPDIRDLNEQGFGVINAYLDESIVRSLTTHIEAFADDSQVAPSTRVKRGIVFARRNLLSQDWVQTFIGSEQVRRLIDGFDSELIAVRAILFDKTGDANWTVPWHQDRSIAVRQRIDVDGFGPWSKKAGVVHVQPPVEILRSMITLRFGIDECDADNGPLRVIPGTHAAILDQQAVERAVAAGKQVLCTTAPGGVVVMRPLLLHASSPAMRMAHRRVLHIEFGPAGLPGGLQWARVYPGKFSFTTKTRRARRKQG